MLARSARGWHECRMQSSHPEIARAFDLARAGREEEAQHLITRLAGEGNGEALFLLADMCWRGAGVEQDLGRARELFRQSSDRGFEMGVRAYTNLLASGIAGHRDWQGALARLRAEASGDRLRAMMLSLIDRMRLDGRGNPNSLPAPERLSEKPLAMIYRGAFSRDECDYLRLAAEPGYAPSTVEIDRSIVDPIRTSDGSTIHWLIEDPAIHAINRRLAALSGTQYEQGEPLQMLRYRPGQQYRNHVDWLGEAKPRILTALIYLNEDYQGGETVFPRAGLSVRGRSGDCLVFRSVGPDGGLDPMSEHAGLPVTSGTKYIASRWIRSHAHIP